MAETQKKTKEEKAEERRERARAKQRFNDRTGGRILINPSAVQIIGVTPVSARAAKVEFRSIVTGVEESALYFAKQKDGSDLLGYRNYMKQVGEDEFVPDDYKVAQFLVEVRPYTYPMSSPKAGMTVMNPAISDIPKASVESMPSSRPAGDGHGPQMGAVIEGFMRIVRDDGDQIRAVISMRDQDGNVPRNNNSVFFDIPKTMLEESFAMRAIVTELGREKEDGAQVRGVYVSMPCMLDANTFMRPRPEDPEKAEAWERSRNAREQNHITSREAFKVEEIVGIRALSNWDKIKERQAAIDKEEAKAETYVAPAM